MASQDSLDAELAKLAERGEFWDRELDDAALMSLTKRQSRETGTAVDTVKRSMLDLREQCEQLQASCTALTTELHHLAAQKHSVQAAPDDAPPPAPDAQHTVVLHVPPHNPLVVALQAAAAWQRSAPAPLPLPWVFGSAEYLQDPDCGLGSLDGPTQGGMHIIDGLYTRRLHSHRSILACRGCSTSCQEPCANRARYSAPDVPASSDGLSCNAGAGAAGGWGCCGGAHTDGAARGRVV